MEKKHIESGWWYTYPSEKYESVGIIIPNIWKIKTVPNHQPVYIYILDIYGYLWISMDIQNVDVSENKEWGSH